MLFFTDTIADAEGFQFLEEFVGDLNLELMRKELYVPLLLRIIEEHSERCLSLVLLEHLYQLISEVRREHRGGYIY